MKKVWILLIPIILSFSITNALDIKLPSETVSVMAGSNIKIPMTITNSGNERKLISVSIFPPQSQKVMTLVYPQMFYLFPGESKNVSIYFSALKEAKPIATTFTLNVKDLETEKILYQKSITVIVYRNNPLYLDRISLNKYNFYPNESVNISVKIVNSVNQLSSASKLSVKVLYKDRQIYEFERTIDPLGPEKSRTFIFSYHLDPYAPNGTYTIKAVLTDLMGNYIDSLNTQFNVKAVYMIPEKCTKKETHWNLLSTHTKIIVKNTGNVVAPEFYVTETVPKFLKDFLKPKSKPTEIEVKGNKVVYKWLIKDLGPGESVIIEYSISLWFAWIELLIIGGAIYFFFMFSFRPSIRKKYGGEMKRITPEQEIPIIIEVKNKSRKIMRNVIIQDSLPLMTKLVKRFETMKPQVRKLKKSIELIWRFDKLNPGEERVLIYYIKPIVSISGSFSLPSAKLIYYTEKNDKKVMISNSLTIE